MGLDFFLRSGNGHLESVNGFSVLSLLRVAISDQFYPLDVAPHIVQIGGVTRTLFGKMAVIMWRRGGEPHRRVAVPRAMAAELSRRLAGAITDLDRLLSS